MPIFFASIYEATRDSLRNIEFNCFSKEKYPFAQRESHLISSHTRTVAAVCRLCARCACRVRSSAYCIDTFCIRLLCKDSRAAWNQCRTISTDTSAKKSVWFEDSFGLFSLFRKCRLAICEITTGCRETWEECVKRINLRIVILYNAALDKIFSTQITHIRKLLLSWTAYDYML